MARREVGQAVRFAVPAILAIIFVLFSVSYAISAFLGLPYAASVPLPLRAAGAALVLAGAVWGSWIFRHRKPSDMLVSTYVTLLKLVRRIPRAESAGRTEPLVVSGPQRYVRSPLYLGVVVEVFGWALVSGVLFLFVAGVVVLAWFSLVMVPFEENELAALFGEEWESYAARTPMLFPFTKWRRRT